MICHLQKFFCVWCWLLLPLSFFYFPVQPVLTEDEYRHTKFVVDTFRTGIGKVLHEKLKLRANNSKNWVSTDFDHGSYNLVFLLRCKQCLYNKGYILPIHRINWMMHIVKRTPSVTDNGILGFINTSIPNICCLETWKLPDLFYTFVLLYFL